MKTRSGGGWVFLVGVSLVGPLGCGGQSGSGSPAGPSAGAGSQAPTSGVTPAPRGGSRLKARVAEAASGASQFLGWQDTELDIQCAFQGFAGDALRCLPSGPDSASVSGEADTTLFGDDACSRPAREVSFSPSLCTPPRFAQVVPVTASLDYCQSELSYWLIGASLRFVYRKDGDNCTVVDLPEPSNVLAAGYFEVEPYALDGFVSGTLHEGAELAGIRPVYLSTADGAEAFTTFRDAKEGFDCDLSEVAGELRCIPGSMPFVTGGDFADEDCQSLAAIAVGCSSANSVPYVVDWSPGSASSDGLRVLEGGARLDTSYTGTSLSGACTKLESAMSAFAIGDQVPSSRFVAAALDETADSQGLVAPIKHAGGWSVAGHLPVRSQEFMGFGCALLPTSDGVVRCVPSPTFYEFEFADPNCRTEAVVGGWSTTTAVAFGEQCPSQVNVFARGEEYAGPVYRKDGDDCVFSHDEPPQPARTIYHRVDGQLAPEAFAAMPITLR